MKLAIPGGDLTINLRITGLWRVTAETIVVNRVSDRPAKQAARWSVEQGPHLWGCDRVGVRKTALYTRALARFRVAPTARRQALLLRPRSGANVTLEITVTAF
ncbi:MAG: hypothetical protein ACXW2I_20535 [Burkholderiales bacterium]